MNKNRYFWVNGKIKTLTWKNDPYERESIIINCNCLDACYEHPRDRYGSFLPSGHRGGMWQAVPLEHFESEFRAALLLLGVS